MDPLNGLAFSPTIEPEHGDAILSKGPRELLQSTSMGSVPFLSGFNSLEGAVFQYSKSIELIREYKYLQRKANLIEISWVVSDLSEEF